MPNMNTEIQVAGEVLGIGIFLCVHQGLQMLCYLKLTYFFNAMDAHLSDEVINCHYLQFAVVCI